MALCPGTEGPSNCVGQVGFGLVCKTFQDNNISISSIIRKGARINKRLLTVDTMGEVGDVVDGPTSYSVMELFKRPQVSSTVDSGKQP